MNEESFLGASRRQFMATVAAVAGAGTVAGCAEVDDDTSREYEAEGAGLSEAALEELALAEMATDTERVTRSAEEFGVTATDPENGTSDGLSAGDEVAIVNKIVRYERDLEAFDEASDLRPTLLDSFVRTHNSEGNRGAVVAALDDASSVMLDVPRFGGAGQTLVAPMSGPFLGESDTVDVLAILTDDEYADATEDGTLPAGGGYLMSIEEFMPGPEWDPAESGAVYHSPDAGYNHLSRWFPGGAPAYDDPGDLRVLVLPAGARPKNTFGRVAEEMPGERIAEGEAFSTGNNPFLVAVPGEVADWPTPDNFDEVPWPSAMGGVGYGVSVLSSPNEEINGQAASRMFILDYADILTGDRADRLLTHPTGEASEGSVEWLDGPEELTDSGTTLAPDGQEIFDQKSELRTFAGLTTYGSAIWLTFVHVARVVADDVVVMAGSHATPVGPADPDDEMILPPGFRADMEPVDPWLGSGAEFSALVGERLSPGVPDY